MRNSAKFLILMLVMLSVVGAAAPITSVSTAPSGLEIRTAFPEVLMKDRAYDFHVHVFNTSDGAYMIEDTSCYIHLYNSTGHHIYEGVDSVASHDFDYAWDINGGNFTTAGILQYIIQCNDTIGQGGFLSSSLIVTPSGKYLEPEDSIINGFLGMLVLGLAFFFLAFAKGTEHAGVKLFLNMIAYLIMVLLMGGAYIVLQSTQTGILPLLQAVLFVVGIVLIIIMYYIFINLTRQSLALMRAKRGFGSGDDDPDVF